MGGLFGMRRVLLYVDKKIHRHSRGGVSELAVRMLYFMPSGEENSAGDPTLH
jgi:hypothetical protein